MAELAHLDDFAAGLDLAPIPAWVTDWEITRFVWANQPALGLWRAASLEELYARDIASNAPAKVTARMQGVREAIAGGESVREEWAFYPRGEPVMIELDMRAVHFDDGRLGILNQAAATNDAPSESLQRAMIMARHSAVMGALVDADGRMLSQNAAALEAFGPSESWLEWFVDPAPAKAVLHAALAGETPQIQARVRASDALRWHAIEAQSLRDPVSSKLGVFVEHRDETARVEAEELAADRGRHIDELSAALELVERQRREILALSAPLLDVGEGVLAVPLIGRLDAEQSEPITERLLHAVARRGTRHVILDLTGVAGIDVDTGGRLEAMIRALGLLGATVVVTGVRAQLARELLSSGITLDGLVTHRSLARGLRHAMRGSS